MMVSTKMVISNSGGEKWSDFRNILRTQPAIFFMEHR